MHARSRACSPLRALFEPARGAHSTRSVRRVRMVESHGAVLGLDPNVLERLNQIAPQSRRMIRERARAVEHRSRFLASASLATLVATVAAGVTLSGSDEGLLVGDAVASAATIQLKRLNTGMVSRSTVRAPLDDTMQVSAVGDWQTDGSVDADRMSRPLADNPQVASLMESDRDVLPEGFDPNHATGDSGNAYSFSQCTWWVYVRRHQLGLPVGSYMGNGNMWADSARALGYWVDDTPRHVGDIMVFAAGQAGSDAYCGHVAIVERINPDGSIVTSECGAAMNGATYSRTYTNPNDFQFIHY